VSKAVSGLVTLTFDLESGIRVTCDLGYLGANFVIFLNRGSPELKLKITIDN